MDDELLYERLQTLDYENLDYSGNNNLSDLFNYIEFKKHLGYNDYYDLLNILKKHSLIGYLYYLSYIDDKYKKELKK